jgi:asparagine synthase (glutamine-hydrolysing)
MCGIFALLGLPTSGVNSYVIDHFTALQHRGPDHTCFKQVDETILGFHRLKINDQSSAGNQPMDLHGCHLVCNGEIYNAKSIQEKYDFKLKSRSDCEVILHLYNHHRRHNTFNAVQRMCRELDGEFAFVLYDEKNKLLVAARDPFGVRPLFYGHTSSGNVCFASELKGLNGLVLNAKHFLPGWFHVYDGLARIKMYTNRYYQDNLDFPKTTSNENYQEHVRLINKNLRNAVSKRIMNADDPKMICGLLSGGIDSSLVCALAAQQYPEGTFKTFSIGMTGSPDLYYADMVARYIKSDHTNVILDKQDFLDAIKETIRIIESYDTTTVRASVGNYLVCKYIKENHPEIKVVLNGDYSDEVTGGYKYMKHADSDTDFANECQRLLKDIYMFDSLRSDRTISSQGLEARTPFSDPKFVEHYTSLPEGWRSSLMKLEKSLLRQAFYEDKILPDEILFREKEAFSDGVSSTVDSWHTIVQMYVNQHVNDKDMAEASTLYMYNTPKTKEQLYYRKVFDSFYNHPQVIPYFWLPRFCGTTFEPSARNIG